MRYKIGDVAKILGISPDLLRYYQKKGVVSPETGKSNNYRYYDAWDINFLIDCLWFKGYGFGIEQTARLVSDSTYDDVMRDMTAQCEDIRANIRRETMLLERSEQYFAAMRRTRSMLGRCDLVYSPEFCRYLNRHNDDYEHITELRGVSQQWLQYMPFVNRCFEIDRADLENHTDNYAWGYSMGMDFVEKLGVPIEPPVVRLPSEPSIHAVFTSSGKSGFSPRHMRFVMDYAREMELPITGNARGNLVCSIIEDGKLTGFFEVWLPVEPREGLVFAHPERAGGVRHG